MRLVVDNLEAMELAKTIHRLQNRTKAIISSNVR